MSSLEGFPTVELSSADASTVASFVPEANLVCCSLRHRGAELLDRRRGLRAYAEQGKTMGIPLLYPWANRLADFGYRAAGHAVALDPGDARITRDSQGLPSHGVLPRLLRWEVEDGFGGDALAATLRWESAELLALFPFPHRTRVEAAVGSGSLSIATTVTPTAAAGVPVSFGYHPFLHLPGTPRHEWRIELGVARRQVLDERMIPTGEREPVSQRSFELADASWDDAFDAEPAPTRFEVAAGERALSVVFRRGYPFAQVFAPAERDCVCFEPMTAPANALRSGDGLPVVAPGGAYRAEFTITASSRAAA